MFGANTLRNHGFVYWLAESRRIAGCKVRHRLARWRRALAYARDRMTAEDASQIAYDCQEPAGRYPLATINVSDVLELARDCWGNNPDLPRLAADAVDRVASKWSGYPDAVQAAEEWAFDLIREYAAEEGIDLVEID